MEGTASGGVFRRITARIILPKAVAFWGRILSFCSQNRLGRPQHFGKCLQFFGSTIRKHLIDHFDRNVFAFDQRTVNQLIQRRSQRVSDPDQRGQTQFCCRSFDVRNVRRLNSGVFRKLRLRPSFRLPARTNTHADRNIIYSALCHSFHLKIIQNFYKSIVYPIRI